jgi:hypothetical protein
MFTDASGPSRRNKPTPLLMKFEQSYLLEEEFRFKNALPAKNLVYDPTIGLYFYWRDTDTTETGLEDNKNVKDIQPRGESQRAHSLLVRRGGIVAAATEPISGLKLSALSMLHISSDPWRLQLVERCIIMMARKLLVWKRPRVYLERKNACLDSQTTLQQLAFASMSR